MFIDKLTIENFQSHRHTEIKLSPGVTVLVGESDAGKSAVIRALRWLFLNEPRGSGFVRQGASGCRVAVRYSDGTGVERRKDGGRNVYTVTRAGGPEDVYEGFGASVPDEVANVTGVRRIDAGGASFAPNVAGQLDPPFLLGEPGSVGAALLGLLSRADVFDAALKDTLADTARLRREARALEDEIASLDGELEKYADLPRWEEALGEADRLLEEAGAASGRKTVLERLFSDLAGAKASLVEAKKVLVAAAGLDAAAALLAEADADAAVRSALSRLRGEILSLRGELKRAGETLDAARGCLEAGAILEIAGTHVRELAALKAAIDDAARLRREVRVFGEIAGAAAGAEAAGSALAEVAALQERKARLMLAAAGMKEAAGQAAASTGILGKTEGVGEAESLLVQVENDRKWFVILADLQCRLQKAGNLFKESARVAGAGEAVGEAGDLVDALLSLVGKRDALACALGEYRRTESEVAAAAERETETRAVLERRAEELGSLLKELGRCPVCLNKIEGEDVREIVEQLVS
ncbi:ATP-binding protein [Desulfofundulus thermosubterraneus]|uniref:Nuclease SbcCD subunit C n=1 Tax=Desulfofundulus thermosubterraneus DSM 16057 TaxID=1121432 RepID=A0A1M6JGK3_9FIRM|nr:AAA family ATPase [Desulfofundulus thermosubterraneus]SHJ45858.1 AAA domain-containing protein [Desulfofundulus thermosubterraneus DSM 16057]